MTYLLGIRRLHFEINKWVVLDENTGLIRLIPVYQILYCRLDVGWNSNIFDRESISHLHGHTSLKIVVLLGTLLKVTAINFLLGDFGAKTMPYFNLAPKTVPSTRFIAEFPPYRSP